MKCQIDVDFVMADFEKAMRRGAIDTWNCVTLGCYFHYTQCINRRFKQNLLIQQQKNNQNLLKVKKYFMKLPLLPKNYVNDAFIEIKKFQKNRNLSNIFKEFNNYFYKNWLSYLSSSTTNLSLLTNNISESFNAKLKRKIRRNPSTMAFLGKYTILKLLSLLLLFQIQLSMFQQKYMQNI